MKRFTGPGAAALWLACGAAQAGDWYVGASLGVMDSDVRGFDETTNAGLLVGYDVYRLDIFHLALEGEVTTTVSDGDVESNGVRGDWDIDTQAAYLAARLGGDFFIKVRFGGIREDISIDVAGFSRSETDTGGSWSGALGWQIAPHWAVQLEGTLIEADLNYWNAGLNYRF